MPKKEEKRRRLEDKIGPIESVIASNTKFKGKINAQDNVLISGKFSGDIQCEQLVKIDSGGKVKGTVSSTYIIIEGELKGDIQSAEHVEIRQGGRVIGNINTAEIAIAEGSFIQGEIKMPDKESKPLSFVEKRGSEEPEDIQEELQEEKQEEQED
jgi:cytoskeletal protein CcmA (bactofilin family)